MTRAGRGPAQRLDHRSDQEPRDAWLDLMQELLDRIAALTRAARTGRLHNKKTAPLFIKRGSLRFAERDYQINCDASALFMVRSNTGERYFSFTAEDLVHLARAAGIDEPLPHD